VQRQGPPCQFGPWLIALSYLLDRGDTARHQKLEITVVNTRLMLVGSEES
jgi:hypothetical protein